MSVFTIPVPYQVTELGGLHAWVYSNMFIRLSAEKPKNTCVCSVKGMAVELDLDTAKMVKSIRNVFNDISGLDFIKYKKTSTIYVWDLNSFTPENYYTRIPYWCIRRIVEHGGRQKFNLLQFYLRVARTINWGTGVGWCSQETLAEKCKCSKSCVGSRFRILENLGVLEVERACDMETSNKYRIPYYKDLKDIPPIGGL